jgi:hypothetical protein
VQKPWPTTLEWLGKLGRKYGLLLTVPHCTGLFEVLVEEDSIGAREVFRSGKEERRRSSLFCWCGRLQSIEVFEHEIFATSEGFHDILHQSAISYSGNNDAQPLAFCGLSAILSDGPGVEFRERYLTHRAIGICFSDDMKKDVSCAARLIKILLIQANYREVISGEPPLKHDITRPSHLRNIFRLE